MTSGDTVALVINTYESTVSRVLRRSFFSERASENLRIFDETILLINNVQNRQKADQAAQDLVTWGEISSFFHVSDLLSHALQQIGLQPEDLGRIPHYSDCVLVAPFTTDAKFLLYWDAEVTLVTPTEWVERSIALLNRQSDVFVASPIPSRREYSRYVGETKDFHFDYGFSDQLFLVRTEDLRKTIYREKCPASLRYPLSHVGSVAEQRLDSYMRNHSLVRALFKDATYLHEGTKWYWPTTGTETARFIKNRAVSRLLKLQPFTMSPRWKI